MKDLNGSQTKKNIMAALQGESIARNRYSFYEEQAKKEGNEDIASMFSKMARNEMIHARMWFRLLNDGLGDSASNIKSAAAGEHGESEVMYPSFAKIARDEGFEEIAKMFEQVARIESDHEQTFLKAYDDLEAKTASREMAAAEVKNQKSVSYKTVHRCMFCGAVYDSRPDVCSVCGAIGSFEQGTAKV